MPSPHPLGDYLRARRELLHPDEVGLPVTSGVRRVPGLRRSEIALLAGISTEYYVKLEQGQERHPTEQVLNALARALQLDSTARSYLHGLAHLPERPVVSVPTSKVERTRWLIDSWPMTAAMILDARNDILATNALMTVLIPGYRVGRNSVEVLLLDPEVRELYVEWEGLTMRSVGLLRARIGPNPGDGRSKEIIAQLTHASSRFRELWNRHDITGMTEGTHPITHPTMGALTLHFAHLPLIGDEDYSIFLYYGEPGTPTERALADLVPGR